jgi:hypothetical protein
MTLGRTIPILRIFDGQADVHERDANLTHDLPDPSWFVTFGRGFVRYLMLARHHGG